MQAAQAACWVAEARGCGTRPVLGLFQVQQNLSLEDACTNVFQKLVLESDVNKPPREQLPVTRYKC